MPVDREDNKNGEAIESDSLVNREVLNGSALPVKFVPASVVSSGWISTHSVPIIIIELYLTRVKNTDYWSPSSFHTN